MDGCCNNIGVLHQIGSACTVLLFAVASRHQPLHLLCRMLWAMLWSTPSMQPSCFRPLHATLLVPPTRSCLKWQCVCLQFTCLLDCARVRLGVFAHALFTQKTTVQLQSEQGCAAQVLPAIRHLLDTVLRVESSQSPCASNRLRPNCDC